MIIKYTLFSLLLIFSFYQLNAQTKDSLYSKTKGGSLSLGVRNTISAFNDGNWNNLGIGTGGQFRLQFSDRVNSDWFFDYITGNIGDYAIRNDYHIGWSVLFYPLTKIKKIKPYILAGHCFDYTHQKEAQNFNNFAKRWSSAVQGGLGVHYFLTPKLDASLTCQYMMHLGNHVHAENKELFVNFHTEKGVNLEGHLLWNISLNYKIAQLWK